MGKQITAMTLIGLEVLYRDAVNARLDLIRMERSDPAIDEALNLLADIAFATSLIRWPGAHPGVTEMKRRAARLKAGG
jgi:hypothetical protein